MRVALVPHDHHRAMRVVDERLAGRPEQQPAETTAAPAADDQQ
nr:hypothetical protein [Prauserella sp. PE36]